MHPERVALSVIADYCDKKLIRIGWDGEDDPLNPRNWAQWRKGVVIGIISTITFFSPLASSMFAPGIPSVMADFNSTNASLGTFCVSVYILVFAFLGGQGVDHRVLRRDRYCGHRYLRCSVGQQSSTSPMFYS